MKRVVLFFLCLLATDSISGHNEIKFKVVYNELYATYDFIEKISENYPDNAFKDAFANSKYNDEAHKSLIKQWETLQIDYNYYFDQYSPTLKNSLASRSLIEKNLIDSRTLDEFKTKSFGIIPNEELKLFSQAIASFVPIYNELIYEPNQGVFENHLSNLNKELVNNDVSRIYTDVMKFYGTNWDDSIPLQVIAYPTIGKSGIGARAFLNISVIRFPLNFKNYDVMFSVMLHEIFHIGYDSQPISLKNDLKTWFSATTSSNSQYAFLLLNEVLATALGNGYAYEKMKSEVDTEDWYYVKYVNLMAKKIYPTAKAYLEQGKTIDQDFVKTYLELYDTGFPEWNKELDNILTYRVILCEDIEETRYFRRNYPYTFHKTILSVSAKEIEEIQQQPLTKIIIVSDKHKEKLQLIKQHFGELKNTRFDAAQEFIKIVDLQDRTKLMVINKHASTIESLMNTAFSERKLK